MKCPVCNDVDLVMSERQGVEIDYCPNCRGIWLDRGELDKILERGNAYEANPQAFQQTYYKEQRHHDHDYHKHKRKHWLNDLFD